MRKDENPLVSIVMPAYNASKTIEMAIDSVLSQTYRHWELIVVDDCSQDDTKHIVERYAVGDTRVRMLVNKTNSGVSLARMRGVDAANGQWVALLDSDDAWKKDKLEKQLAAQKKKNAELVFTASTFMNAQGVLIDWILHVPPAIGYRRLLKQNLISNSSVLVSKEVYQRCAVCRDDIHEDFACWLNFLKEGNVAHGVDEPLLIYRLTSASKSGNKLKSALMNWKTYRTVGLGRVASAYYMVWYVIHGVLKYRCLKGKTTE